MKNKLNFDPFFNKLKLLLIRFSWSLKLTKEFIWITNSAFSRIENIEESFELLGNN
jgi:hypothetical protein